jgi:hypothetical protein
MLASGEFADPGIRALEHLGRSEAASARLVADLRARGVEWKERTESIA